MPTPRKWSLTQRLSVIVSGIVALAMLLFLAVFTLIISSSERSALLSEYEALAQHLAIRANNEGLHEQGSQAVLTGLSPYSYLQHVHIYRIVAGQPVMQATYNAPGRAALERRALAMSDRIEYQFSLDHLEITHPIHRQNTVIGYVYLRVSTERVKLAHQKNLLISVAALILLLISVALSVRFYGRSLESSLLRFSRLIAKAAQDSHYNLDDERDLPDEFADLRLQIKRLLEKYRHERRYAEHNAQKAEKLTTALNQQVSERTAYLSSVNEKLSQALAELHKFQRQRLDSDKMASFGDVVAGIAHELNTPLGTALTCASLLVEQQRKLQQAAAGQQLSKAALNQYLHDSEQQMALLERNLQRCSELLRHFQQLTMLNRTDAPQHIEICNFLTGFYQSMVEERGLPAYVQLHIHCAHHNEIVVLRKLILEQVLSELIDNSLVHGVISVPQTNTPHQHLLLKINIEVQITEQHIIIEYSDDGQGVEPALRDKIFQPFITTNRAAGDKGLGLFQVFNWVTQLLHGDITCTSSPYVPNDDQPHGINFTITLPRNKQANRENAEVTRIESQ